MIEEFKNIKSEKKDLRNFGLIVGVALIIISFLIFKKRINIINYSVPLGFILIILGLIYPTILKPLQKIWMMISVILGFFMTRIIIFILFVIAFIPLSFALKIFNKKLIDVSINKRKKSYWVYREAKKINVSDYEKQY